MFWDVPLQFALVTVLVWAVVARALLVSANFLPATCAACGLRLERRRLGEPVCGCRR